MKVLLRIVAVLFVAIGAFLVYAVIHALGSDGGAPCAASPSATSSSAALLTWAAVALWRRGSGSPAAQV